MFIFFLSPVMWLPLKIFEKIMIFLYFNVLNERCKTFCIVINNVLNIVINIQNTTIFEPVILTGFYTSKVRLL